MSTSKISEEDDIFKSVRVAGRSLKDFPVIWEDKSRFKQVKERGRKEMPESVTCVEAGTFKVSSLGNLWSLRKESLKSSVNFRTKVVSEAGRRYSSPHCSGCSIDLNLVLKLDSQSGKLLN